MVLDHKQKKRVLFVVLYLSSGGSERVVFELVSGLDLQKYEIYIAAFEGGVLEAQLKPFVEKIILLNKTRGLDVRIMYKIAQIIRKYKIDIVNAHHFMPCFYSFWGACILNRKKLVYTEHSCPEVENIANSIYGKIFNLMFYRINAVIGVSKEIARLFRKYYPIHSEKAFVVSNGVDIERFKNKSKRDEIRKKYGIGNGSFVIGTVANFRKIKNHICLLRAAKILKRDYPQIHLLFVGTGWEKDTENSEPIIKKAIAELGLFEKVILVGHQEDIPGFLSAFDIFCLPSLSEGLPVSILEAMASGVPVVGSKVNGIAEVVCDRKNGMLFDNNNHEMLALCIIELINDRALKCNLAREALKFVKEEHNKDVWIDKYSSIL